MIDVARRRAPRGRPRATRPASPPSATRPTTACVLDEIRDAAARSPPTPRYRLAADAFGTVAAYYAEIAAYLNQIGGNVYPQRLALVLEKVADLPYGENPHQRAAFYRETTHRSRHARRRDAAPRRAADVQQPARPRRRLPDRGGLHLADGRHRQAHRPGRARLERGARRGLPARARDRPRRVVRRDRRRQPRARRRDGARDRGQLVRGGRRARLRAGGARDPRGEGRPRAARRARPSPTEGMRDYGIANLDFKRVGGGLLVETLDALDLDRGQLQVVTRRRPTLDELDRPAVRLAGGAPRPVERDRARPERRDGRDRRRPGEPQRVGGHRAPPGRRPGEARGDGVGRLLPVPRRHPDRRQRRRHRDHPAGRLHPRRDGDRGRRPPPPGDGLHRPRHFRH